MIYRRVLILLVLWAGTSSLQAVLPADAGARQQEILDYRRRKTAEFEEMQREYEADLVRRAQQVRQELAAPPWGLSGSAAARPGTVRSEPHKTGSSLQIRKWIFSALAFFLIGGSVWWVRAKTEPRPPG